jgi:hypothetical protein
VRDAKLAGNFATFEDSVESLLIDPNVESYVASPFYDCMYAAMYATAAAAFAASPTLPPNLLTNGEIASGVAAAATDAPAGQDVNLYDIDDIGDILALLIGAKTTTLAGTSMYYGLDPQTGVPALQMPAAPVGLSCIDQTHSWVSTGVLYGSIGPDGGSALVTCP